MCVMVGQTHHSTVEVVTLSIGLTRGCRFVLPRT